MAEERTIQLSAYVPEFFSDIWEIQKIYETEEEELKRLYRTLDGLWTESFIASASLQGLKRLETIAGLKPYSGDTTEERRAALLMKWNQQLPYTMARLKERLDSVVGKTGYRIALRNQEYKLDVQVINQTIRVLRTLFEMTEQMIPANMDLTFSGLYPMEVKKDISWENGIRLPMEYYPRYNLAYLYLDGSWKMDGSKELSGYDGVEQMEFYPVSSRIHTEIQREIRGGVQSFSVQTETRNETEYDARGRIRIEARVGKSDGGSDNSIQAAGQIRSIAESQWDTGVMEASVTIDRRIDGTWQMDGSRKLDGRRHIL